MTEANGTVFVVDDDEAVRDALSLLLESESLPCRCFASADEFLAAYEPGSAGCLLLDIRMPGKSGLELRDWLDEQGARLPIIFITGHGDVPMAVDAMRRGAIDFIQKPFNDEDLLKRVRQALASAADEHAERAEIDRVRENYDKLTPREREVMAQVVSGSVNKVIALDLDISQRTVEIHRARVMHKMGVRSVAELVRLAAMLDT